MMIGLRQCLLALSLACLPSAAAAAQGSPRTNIILFLVDDLGWQDSALQLTPEPTAQNKQWRTPNLDGLAARGMRFSNAYAAAPVCTPTRTSLLTGRTPGATHITYWTSSKDQDTSAPHPSLRAPDWRRNGLGEGETTFPQLLADAGYRTIHAGKAHFGAKGTFGDDPLQLGFQVNIGGHAAGQPGSYLAKENFTTAMRTGKVNASTYWDVPGLEDWHGEDVFLTEVLAAEAGRAIQRAVEDRVPFYLNFAPYAVHTPLTANVKLLPHFAHLDEREATYGTMIESVDNALGVLLAKLDDLGVAESTAIVFMSDNGGLSAHGRGAAPDGTKQHHHNAPLKSGKGSAFEGGTRVPMAVLWPGHTKQGTWSSQPVITYDLFPTFLAMANVELRGASAALLEGQNLAPVFESDTALPRRSLFWNQPHQWGAPGPGIEPFTSLRKDNWKLIYFHAGPHFELYDLDRDLGEQNNLATSKLDLVLELATEMQQWIVARDVQLSIAKDTAQPIPGPLATARGLLERQEQSAPNILLMVADDLGWTDLSGGSSNLGNGSDYYETPHTDSLAAAGLSFTNAYANGPNCAPTRASLMSGMWAARTGIYTVGSANRGRPELRLLEPVRNTTELSPEVFTLAEALREAGYRTGHFGKWHLGGKTDGTGIESPGAQGFDANFGGDKRGNAGGRQFADAAGAFDLPGLDASEQPGQWVDDRLTDEALSFILSDETKPFFVNMNFFAVHTPIQSPQEDRDHFDEKVKGERHNSQAYAGIVKSFDDNVGRLIRFLEETDDPRSRGHKLIENTLIVFTSDNGGVGGYLSAGITGGLGVTDNAPLRAGKGVLHEGGIRVPLIVRWDGKVGRGAVSKELATTIDLFPTLLQAAGHDGSKLPLDGAALTLSGGGPLPTRSERQLFWHFPAYLEAGRQTFRTTPVSAIREGRWKLLFFYEDRHFELFDLEEDLGEHHDLTIANPTRVRELSQKLSHWLRVTSADLPCTLGTGLAVAYPDDSPSSPLEQLPK